jgi:hypothetical protein
LLFCQNIIEVDVTCLRRRRVIIHNMKLTYETGVATLAQFVVMGFLNIAVQIDSIITTCTHSGGDCLGNAITSIGFYIAVMIWFGFVMVVGYAAQARRSKRVAQLLIAIEALVALVALYNIKSHSGFFGFVTSLVDVVLAIWIIILAYRLMKSGGRRVVNKKRVRRHTLDA